MFFWLLSALLVRLWNSIRGFSAGVLAASTGYRAPV